MTTKCREYIRELKFEAILVIDHELKIIEVAESLEIGISSLDNQVRKYKKDKQGTRPTEDLALIDDQCRIQELEEENRRLNIYMLIEA